MGVTIPVDFTGVEQRGSTRVPEGDYVAKIRKVEKVNAKSSGNPMLVCRFELVSGPSDVQGKQLVDRHVLTKDSLWTLRNMLEAIGYKVPASQMKLDVDKMLIGKTLGVTVVDGDEYKGKIRSEIADYLPASAVGNVTSGEDADIEEDEDDLGVFLSEDDEDEEVDETQDEEPEEDDEEDEEGFAFPDDEGEEDEEDEEELSFGPDDLGDATAKELQDYAKEAMAAGWELDLPKKPKKDDVLSALSAIFDEEDEDDEDEMEEFSLDDLE